MAEDVVDALTTTIGETNVPTEYIDFLMSERFGWTPQQIDEMPLEQYELYYRFMQAQGEAGTLREHRRAQNARS